MMGTHIGAKGTNWGSSPFMVQILLMAAANQSSFGSQGGRSQPPPKARRILRPAPMSGGSEEQGSLQTFTPEHPPPQASTRWLLCCPSPGHCVPVVKRLEVLRPAELQWVAGLGYEAPGVHQTAGRAPCPPECERGHSREEPNGGHAEEPNGVSGPRSHLSKAVEQPHEMSLQCLAAPCRPCIETALSLWVSSTQSPLSFGLSLAAAVM